MKRFFTLLLVVACLPGCAGKPKELKSQVSLEKAEVSLGKIPHSRKQLVPVTLINTGSDDLEITAVKTSCGCTTLKDNPKSLPARSKLTMKVKYNPGDDKGAITRTVIIRTDNGILLLFRFSATVV